MAFRQRATTKQAAPRRTMRSERSEPLDTASGAIKHVIHSVVVRQLGQATHQ